MTNTALIKLLSDLNQRSLKKRIENLNTTNLNKIYEQLQRMDKNTFEEQINLIRNDETISKRAIKPYRKILQSGDPELMKRGKQLIREGKVGCLIVAGGQATRFGIDGPKGVYPISNVCQKSLFQIFFEKCAAAGKEAGRKLPMAVMTSPLNHAQTQSFIEANHYFGLSVDQVDLFQQSMLPFLDVKGELFLESDSALAEGPDGNGSSLNCFVKAGLLDKWRRQGVEIVIYILVDNPLADPFDAELAGILSSTHSDAVIKCTDRRAPTEKVGVIVEADGKPRVIEYFELPSEASSWDDLYANISLFAFSLDFIEKVSKEPMPLHKAFKPTKSLDSPDGVVKAWKFEKFIFDVLEKANRVNVVRYPRERCFAPLKNMEGADSPVEVRGALLARDRAVYSEITGLLPPSYPIELSQQFYYPTPELIARWKGKDAADTAYLE